MSSVEQGNSLQLATHSRIKTEDVIHMISARRGIDPAQVLH